MLKFLLFLLFILFKVGISQIITIPLQQGLEGYEVFLYIGNSCKLHQFQLNMEKDYLFLNYYSLISIEPESTIHQPVVETNMITNESGFITTSTFYLNSGKFDLLTNFPFITIINIESSYPINYIPLSFKYQNESYSIIHRLYKDNNIKRKGFGLIFHQPSKNPVLSLGGYEEKHLGDFKYKTVIPVNTQKTTW